MRITKLKIFGFKSFAQRTEINFPGNGLTAVVGPNGCGKSNIVDAIRWVLGEQRAVTLRMNKMQDVIFSGTEERAAMSMAEVSLVIDNSSGDLPSEYSEVMVTRRAYRNGTSEYLLNNQECRLKDIQNLFFDSGLGTGTYSQMNERMINAVLSDKAEDRSALFEEAAGVSKYKKQRKETVSRLESVQRSMERVEDNLRHTRASVNQYERQAQKAKEWQALRNRLRELDLSVSMDKFEDQKRSLEILNVSHKRLDHDMEAEKTRLEVLKAKIDERRLAISGDEAELLELRSKVSLETLNLNNLNNEVVRLRDRERTIAEASERAEGEIENAELQIKSLTETAEKLEEEIELLGRDVNMDSLGENLEREQEALLVLRNSCDELRTRQREVSEERIQTFRQVNELKARWQRVEAGAEMHRANAEKWTADLTDLRSVLGTNEGTLTQLAEQAEELSRRLETLEEERTVTASSLEDLRQEVLAASKLLQGLREEEAALKSRLEVLTRMAASGEGGSKWLLENRGGLALGRLGELVEVKSPEFLKQVEFALGEALDALVLENDAELSALLTDLETAAAGSAIFAVKACAVPAPELPALEGTLGAAANFVTAEGQVGVFVKRLLSRWMLADSFETALALAKRYAAEDFWFVAPGNRAVHTSGMVRGGSSHSLGVLSCRAEIDEANSRLEKLSEQIRGTEASHDHATALAEETSRTLENLESDLRDLHDKRRAAEASTTIHSNAVSSLSKQIEKLERDVKTAHEEIAAAEAAKVGDRELAEAEAKAEKLEAEYGQLDARLAEEEQMMRNKEEDVREADRMLRDSKTALSERQTRLHSLRERLPVFENIVRTRQAELEANEVETAKLSEELESLAGKIEAKHTELSELERARDEAEEHYNVISGDLEEWRSEERAVNAKLMELLPQIKDLELRAEAVRMNMQRLRERVFAEWEVEVDKPEGIQYVEYDADAEKEIRELRSRLKALGPVNQGVMEDYEEEKKRLEEVSRQFDDLDRARASLERTIRRLDEVARNRFLDTFHKIQKNFQDVFSRLMKDGGTKLTLQEGVDPLEAEIEVNARPTGKKMRGVKALSGGERALTAVSLLFAIYMEKPSPYCVLDEVDGPLDDANIGRFVELLRHFSRQTQFILVTHNKRTMAASDMLYGVTQEIKGISRIASVKLEDVNPSNS